MAYAGIARAPRPQNQFGLTVSSQGPGFLFSRVILMVWWAKEYPVLKAATEADTSANTACQVYQWLREVCPTRLLQTQIVLGGPGIIVQVDESQFRHKPKVIHKIHTSGILTIFIFSITVVEGHAVICGCSALWMWMWRLRRWVIWRSFRPEMLLHCCL